MARFCAPAVVAVSLLGASAALAKDDACRSAMSQWQPKNVAQAHVAGFGIAVDRLKIDDGCYEVYGRDGEGNRVELSLDPATLAVMKLEVTFRRGADPARYLAAANAPPREAE